MSEPQSPARRNNPAPAAPPGNSQRAGFKSTVPLGTGASGSGPYLTGWPRSISWSEFKELTSRPSGEKEDAQVAVDIQWGELTIVREKGRFRLGDAEFSLVVKASQSWAVKGKKTAELLSHEQGHFDIVGLCWRDGVAEVGKLREKSPRALEQAFRRIMAKYDKRADALSDLYDSHKETDHGKNKKRQAEWEAQIQASKKSGKPMVKPD